MATSTYSTYATTNVMAYGPVPPAQTSIKVPRLNLSGFEANAVSRAVTSGQRWEVPQSVSARGMPMSRTVQGQRDQQMAAVADADQCAALGSLRAGPTTAYNLNARREVITGEGPSNPIPPTAGVITATFTPYYPDGKPLSLPTQRARMKLNARGNFSNEDSVEFIFEGSNEDRFVTDKRPVTRRPVPTIWDIPPPTYRPNPNHCRVEIFPRLPAAEREDVMQAHTARVYRPVPSPPTPFPQVGRVTLSTGHTMNRSGLDKLQRRGPSREAPMVSTQRATHVPMAGGINANPGVRCGQVSGRQVITYHKKS